MQQCCTKVAFISFKCNNVALKIVLLWYAVLFLHIDDWFFVAFG